MRIIRFIKALWKYILHGRRVSFRKYASRLYICSVCENHKDDWTCGVCGCYLDKKAKMSTEKCPKDRW